MSAALHLKAARWYCRRGWAPIPIPHRQKRPTLSGWQHLRLNEDDLAQHFNGHAQNVGILLGEPSAGLTDVDLDCPEACALAPRFLHPTGARFGRPRSPASHWLFVVPGGLRRETFRDPCLPKDDERAMLVEVRGTGHQTVFPPSTHPNGEPITWATGDKTPVSIDLAVLRYQVERLAAASLVARYWPATGSRQDAALALGGGLLHAGWSEDDATAIVEAVALAAGDEEAAKRAESVRFSARAARATGWPTLAKLVGDPVVDSIREWLGMRADASATDPRRQHTDSKHTGSFGSASDESSEQLWQPREPLPAAVPAVPTLPPALVPAAFRSWLVAAAERTCVHLEMVAAPAIVAAGAVVGRSLAIRPGRYDDFLTVPNLWGALVARPGSLKTDTTGEALRPLGRLMACAHEEYLKAAEAAEVELAALDAQIDAIKKQMTKAAGNGDPLTELKERLVELRQERAEATVTERRYLTHDPTIEKLGELLRDNPRGLLLSRDELSGWLRTLDRAGREGDREFYLEAWNGTGSFTSDRIGRGTIHIPALCLSVFGGIQPGKLRPLVDAALDGGAGDDGLLQRLQLLVWPDRLPPWRKPEGWPERDARDRADRVFGWLADLTPGQVRALTGEAIPFLTFTPEAQRVFDQWRDELEGRLRSDELADSPAFAAHLAKYRSLLPSLALIFELIAIADGEHAGTGQVGEAATRQAAAWCEFLECHARKLYAAELDGGLSVAHLLADKIAAGAINDGDSIRDIYRSEWSGLKTPDRVLAGARVLAAHGWLRLTTEGRQGRPSQVVRLHPELRQPATQAPEDPSDD